MITRVYANTTPASLGLDSRLDLARYAPDGVLSPERLAALRDERVVSVLLYVRRKRLARDAVRALTVGATKRRKACATIATIVKTLGNVDG